MVNCMPNRLTIKFDPSNRNAIIIRRNGEIVNMIAIPPSRNRMDMFLSKSNSPYDFDGIIVTQTPTGKEIRSKYKIFDKIEL